MVMRGKKKKKKVSKEKTTSGVTYISKQGNPL